MRDPLLRPIVLTAVFFNIGFFTIQAIAITQARGPGACLIVAVVAFAIQALVILQSPAARLARIPDLRDDTPDSAPA